MSLIFATQLTAVATAALAVFAIATAWYEILAAADELVYESVPADVGCGLVVQARVRGDGGEDIARTAPGQPAAAAVEEQRPLPAGIRRRSAATNCRSRHQGRRDARSMQLRADPSDASRKRIPWLASPVGPAREQRADARRRSGTMP